jgi:peptide-methionine (S)-S-oxide reductase
MLRTPPIETIEDLARRIGDLRAASEKAGREIPPEVILDMFFTIHDPRQLNRQGNDVGTQYRSAMYFADDAQKTLFEAALQRASEHWDGGLVTELSPIETFWPGEEYHQDFFAKNPNQGYCNAVVSPKMAKARAAFTQYLR